ncbi:MULTISPECIES: hypothetical protein [Pseudomonas]|uniref:hypothetical protein n=1 Tax=Pseudomonas TaxID=286 RepID=UPI0014732E14|nr:MULTISPECIES: hypothetical protein [Pseudomonas]MBM1204817.1 hypothetical protein [Pseudomonas fragi]MBM1204913.1 hypothetical protein [Pseudomonas fragi]NMY57993.1 hypothetical protein [Pseudomonas sp. WS 5051]
MRHTIDEAASLVGRTRRSLYRAMTEGRLAYGLEADGRRYIDTAELLRVYGAFDSPSQSVTPQMSHGVTVPSDLGEIIAKAVAEAVEPLRKEIELLRLENAEQRRLEHRPDRCQPRLRPILRLRNTHKRWTLNGLGLSHLRICWLG